MKPMIRSLLIYFRKKLIPLSLVFIGVLFFYTIFINRLDQQVRNYRLNTPKRYVPPRHISNKVLVPLELHGIIKPNLHISDLIEVEELLEGYGILKGGLYIPKNLTKYKIAIIISLRDRDSQLATFLYHYHKIFIAQKLYYRIFGVVQSENGMFNRAKLFNVGIVESEKYGDFDCFIFHDVDFLLENDNLIYGCEHSPAHLSVAVSQFNYQMNTRNYCGGVVAATKSHMYSVNGFTNCYWAWGFEDDDIYLRFVKEGYKVYRPNSYLGRYLSNPHEHTQSKNETMRVINRQRYHLMRFLYHQDGLNSLRYELLDSNEFNLYTRITVELTGKDNCQEIFEKVKDEEPEIIE